MAVNLVNVNVQEIRINFGCVRFLRLKFMQFKLSKSSSNFRIAPRKLVHNINFYIYLFRKPFPKMPLKLILPSLLH